MDHPISLFQDPIQSRDLASLFSFNAHVIVCKGVCLSAAALEDHTRPYNMRPVVHPQKLLVRPHEGAVAMLSFQLLAAWGIPLLLSMAALVSISACCVSRGEMNALNLFLGALCFVFLNETVGAPDHMGLVRCAVPTPRGRSCMRIPGRMACRMCAAYNRS